MDTAEPPPVAPIALPEGIRNRLLERAAEVLSRLDEAKVPGSLRRIRGFAPAKRAKAGASLLATALEREVGFRQAVAADWREESEPLAQALEAGQTPPAADPQEVAVGLYLIRPVGWVENIHVAIDAVNASVSSTRLRQDLDQADAARAKVAVELDRLRGESQTLHARLAAAEEDAANQRREMRRLRSDADRSRAAARTAERERGEAEAQLLAATAERDRLLALLAAERQEADSATETARRIQRQGRDLDDVRARLLLDTIARAATGLARELALPISQTRPADWAVGDLEAAASRGDAGASGGSSSGGAARAESADDPLVLERLLALPLVHLIVDGYNVTKSAFPALTLQDQRTRLIDGLVALAARTVAEVSCCFDGADVEQPTARRIRGVRVIFSRPGVTADLLIDALVRAEPSGRPLIVVSSDREVMGRARAAQAYVVESPALARLLGRG